MQYRRFLWRCLLTLVSASLLLIYMWLLGGASHGPVAYAANITAARAFVIGSDPVDGSTIGTPPQVVRIFFNEEISPASIAHAYVFDVPAGRLVEAAHSFIAPTNAHELDVPLVAASRLPQGIYEVKWIAVASNDGQVTTGLIGFNVGHGLGLQGNTILGPSTSNSPVQLNFISDLSIAWEWLVLLALTFWIGIQVAEGLLVGNDEATRATGIFARVHKQSLPLQWLSLSAFLVGEVVILLLRSISLSNTTNSNGGVDINALNQILFETSYGTLWIVRIALILVLLLLLRRSHSNTNNATQTARTPQSNRMSGGSSFSKLRQRVTQEQYNSDEQAVTMPPETPMSANTRSYTLINLLLAGLIMLTFTLSDDTAQLAQPHISAIVLDWLYFAARSIWLGSLTYLGYILLPLLPSIEQDRQASLLNSMLHRFQPLLLGTVGIFLVSGLYLSESSIFDPHQLTSDPYGRSLLGTLVLVGLMLLLSVYIIFMLRPKLVRQTALLPVIDAEMPTRRNRQSALEQTERSIRQVAVVLSWLGASVLLCSALMSFFAPPIVFPTIDYTASTSANAPSMPTSNTQTQQVGNLSLTLQVLPARSGYTNTVILSINDSAGNPVTDARVQLTINMVIMDMGTGHTTIQGGNPTYIAVLNQNTAFSMGGLWHITVNIQRPNQPPLQTVFQITLNS